MNHFESDNIDKTLLREIKTSLDSSESSNFQSNTKNVFTLPKNEDIVDNSHGKMKTLLKNNVKKMMDGMRVFKKKSDSLSCGSNDELLNETDKDVSLSMDIVKPILNTNNVKIVIQEEKGQTKLYRK